MCSFFHQNSYDFIWACSRNYSELWTHWKTIHFHNLGTSKYWKTRHFDKLWTWKDLNTTHVDNLWTWKYWKTNKFDDLWSMTGGRADGRPGRVTEKHKERINFGNMYPEKLWYCMYHLILTLGYFFKKDVRRKMVKFGGGFAPRIDISHMTSIQARKLKLSKWHFLVISRWRPRRRRRRADNSPIWPDP